MPFHRLTPRARAPLPLPSPRPSLVGSLKLATSFSPCRTVTRSRPCSTPVRSLSSLPPSHHRYLARTLTPSLSSTIAPLQSQSRASTSVRELARPSLASLPCSLARFLPPFLFCSRFLPPKPSRTPLPQAITFFKLLWPMRMYVDAHLTCTNSPPLISSSYAQMQMYVGAHRVRFSPFASGRSPIGLALHAIRTCGASTRSPPPAITKPARLKPHPSTALLHARPPSYPFLLLAPSLVGSLTSSSPCVKIAHALSLYVLLIPILLSSLPGLRCSVPLQNINTSPSHTRKKNGCTVLSLPDLVFGIHPEMNGF